LDPKPISGGPSLIDWRWGPCALGGALAISEHEVLPERIEGQLLAIVVEEVPVDSENDGTDGDCASEARAEWHSTLHQGTKPGLPFRRFFLITLVEVDTLQRVGKFHSLHVNAENSDKEGQVKYKVEYKCDGSENAKVGYPGRNKSGTNVQQSQILEGDGKR
jgi:hypothetical protein